jgi:fructokinase
VSEGPVLTVIGEALIDLVPDEANGERRARPGGSPFNVAIGSARLGNRTSLMARFSHDRYGRLLRRTAAHEGIDLRASPLGAERSSVATASLAADGSVTYEFDMEGTVDWQWSDAELRQLDPETEVLHFGSIAAWTAPGAERIGALVDELRSRGGGLISYDPNIRPAVLGERGRAVDVIERNVGRAHVVKASREDAELLYPELAVDDVAARWGRLGAELVVVTDGADGATAYPAGREPLRRPGRRVEVVDTIGAGDAFSAGLLTGVVQRGLHREERLRGAADATLAGVLDWATLVAAITCQREGADPPRLELVLRRARAGA